MNVRMKKGIVLFLSFFLISLSFTSVGLGFGKKDNIMGLGELGQTFNQFLGGRLDVFKEQPIE